MSISSYACICGQLILSIATPLESLPRRRNESSLGDQSFVIPRSNTNFTLNAIRDDLPTELTGATIKEHWWLYKCPRCGISVGYDLKSAPDCTYILKDALVDMEVPKV
uniref:ARAD1A10648p n=1 Tax=Blastobotrys adeninivorans TaxID=409370 RepID=A0A060SY95_BLAAD